MKKYTISVMYRGQQITKMVCAKNVNEASELLGVNTYFINRYGYKNKIDSPFNGVVAYFDSGNLWRKEKSLIRVEMPLERLIAIIDSHQDKSYAKFKKQIGI
jgi:hypothetical protein